MRLLPDNEQTILGVDWAAEAKGMLKAEMKRRGMTYADLVLALLYVGVQETEANLRNKISRGGFSAAFFLQALAAIGAKTIHIEVEPGPKIPVATWRDLRGLPPKG